MLKLLTVLAQILNNLLVYVKSRQRQKERDELEANPGAWFDGRFGGVRDSTDKTPAAKTDTERDSNK